MKQRSITHHMHFIQTMQHDSVKKIPNVGRGKPALVFRNMKDILRKRNNQGRSTDALFDCVAKEKTECLTLAVRKTKAIDHNMVNYTPKEDDQDCDSDDPNNGSETLKQLKERYRKKKRKAPCIISLVPKQEHNESQVGEDSELEESLSILKSKLSKKRKGKRKWLNQSVSDVHSLVSIKSEEPSSEMDNHLGGEDHILHNVQHCFHGDDTDKECTLTELEYQGWVLSLDYLQTCNEVSSDAFDYVEPLFILPPSIGENTDLVELGETQPQLYLMPAPEDVDKESYDVYPVGRESFSKDRTSLEDQSVDMFYKFHNDASSGQTDEISGDQVQDMFFDTKYDATKTEDNDGNCIRNGSTLGTKTNSTEYSEAFLFSTEITPYIAYKLPEDPELSMEASAERIHPKPENSPTILLTIADVDQSLCSPSADTEKSYLEENNQLGSPFELSPPRMKASCISEMDHPPERLLSTRKVISPASQEKLWKAMKGIELTEELDQYRNKEKLYFRKGRKTEILPDKVPCNSNEEQECKLKGNKVTISSKQIYKKHCKGWKGSQPHSNQKISQTFHSPLGLSTGPTSMQSWSESAMKFSQRQMQDMDCLAKKLMQELKSMKDIVEGSLESEATHATASKINVDEVKTAIKSATKIEERTKKWLSIMARDCNRFCKIMEKLHDKKELSPGSVISKKRKIVFADEAGGVLCHVKVLENDM